jgi:CelD/BcsL family acetyltransferase involved in cellulose biosynthesis
VAELVSSHRLPFSVVPPLVATMSSTESTTAGGQARPADLSIRLHDTIDAVREPWERLAERSGNVFSTWEWADAWCRALGPRGGLAVAECRDASGEVTAILPLCRARYGLRFVGHGPADELGPVCAREDLPAAAFALRELLARRPLGARVLLAERLRGDGPWDEALGGRVLQRESSPVLPLGGRSWDEFLASRSRNFREQVRRRERKLAREHEISYRLTEDPDRLEADFATLGRLHGARWGGSSEAFGGRLVEFHLDFARRALERGWLRLWTLEVDGSPAAAWYGLRFAGADSYYNGGRDPAWDSYAVGFVLLSHTLRDAFESGMTEYRFLRGDEPYKDRFAELDRGVETRLVGAGALGRAAASATAVAAPRLPWRFRRRLGVDA